MCKFCQSYDDCDSHFELDFCPPKKCKPQCKPLCKPKCKPVKCFPVVQKCGGTYKKVDPWKPKCKPGCCCFKCKPVSYGHQSYGHHSYGCSCQKCKPSCQPPLYCFDQYKNELMLTNSQQGPLVCVSAERSARKVTINIPGFDFENSTEPTEIKFGTLDCQYRPKVDTVYAYELTRNDIGNTYLSSLVVTTTGCIIWKFDPNTLIFPTGSYTFSPTGVTFLVC